MKKVTDKFVQTNLDLFLKKSLHLLAKVLHLSLTFISEKNYFIASTLETPWPGANPTIASYNTSFVQKYNATSSLARFKDKNIFF
jgi:hypothetical protein